MHFPIFVDLTDKLVVVIGGGRIATRRIKTLLRFGCSIKVVALQLDDQLRELADSKQIEYVCAAYAEHYLHTAFMVIGATDDRTVNHAVYLAAKSLAIPVNIIDRKEECSFFFPAVFENEHICGGLISKGGQQHGLAKESAARIRELLNGGN